MKLLIDIGNTALKWALVLERIIRYLMSALYGMPGRLGSLNIQRNKSRATLTVSVIVVGAAMTSTVYTVLRR